MGEPQLVGDTGEAFFPKEYQKVETMSLWDGDSKKWPEAGMG
jgi:hypothetical protein